MMRFLPGLIAFMFCMNLSAQITPFSTVEEDIVRANISSEVSLELSEYQTFELDIAALHATLATAPVEFTTARTASAPELALPLVDGSMRMYRVIESSVMEPALQARWPQLRTYRLFAVDNPSHTGRLTVTPQGCSAVYRTNHGDMYLDPYAWGEARYHIIYEEAAAFTVLDRIGRGHTHAHHEENLHEHDHDHTPAINQIPQEVSFRTGGEPISIRNYRLALTCTGEYALRNGGTVESVLATFVSAANLANEVFEREVGVRTTLIEEAESLIFLDPVADPFRDADEGLELLDQVRNAIVSRAGIPLNSYDIGHLFTGPCSDVGGVVSGGARVCGGGKDRAVTCHSSDNLAAIVRNVMVHEVAHQFDVSHSWNNCPGSEDQRSSGAAFEPGAGSTIMSYAGLCGPNNNITATNDVYYHGYSLDEFIDFTREGGGATCATIIETMNTEPILELSYTDGFYIPIETPFELDASATDENGDDITFCWEQLDLGPASTLGSPVDNGPAFRSFPPTVDSSRVFPNWGDLLANRSSVFEVLPNYNRDLTFRCTVRDNNEEAGGTIWDDVAFKATTTAGPFRVLTPNTGNVSWEVGSYQEVTWDVANTDNELVNCHNVNILLSRDGGRTYPDMLLTDAPNTGSAFVTVPDAVGDRVRIRVQAANNIFFDVSNQNFRVIPASEPTYTLDMNPLQQQLCLPATAQIDFTSTAILGYESLVSLSVFSELPEGTTASFSAPTILPGEASTLELDFSAVENVDGSFPITIQAVAPAQDTFFRTFLIDLVDNDFSELALLGPDNGMVNVGFTSLFNWTDIPNALEYDWRISTDPNFIEVHEESMGISTDSLRSTNLLEQNTLYYWQVRPRNECGTGDWTIPAVLHTTYSDCESIAAEGLPISIPVTGPLPTIFSSVLVEESGLITDVNLPLVDLRYNPIQSFDISLISPANTRAVLYQGNCFSSDRVQIGFDDDAPDALMCPLEEGSIFQPQEPLAAFIGEEKQGEWLLEVKINQRGFSSGSLREWGVEFCGSFSPSQPSILVNNPLAVRPGLGNPITRPLLEVTDPDQTAEELYFTIVGLPNHGTLEFAGRTLGIGDQFRQTSINGGNVYYRHNGADVTEDDFFFIVQDGTGGFIPVERFVIVIDEDAVVSTDEISTPSSFELFPNPASNWVTIRLAGDIHEEMPLEVYNAAGQQVWQGNMPNGVRQQQISTRDWPRGIYYLRAGGAVRKLVID